MYHAKVYIDKNFDLFVRLKVTSKTIELINILMQLKSTLMTKDEFPLNLLYKVPNNTDTVSLLIDYSINNQNILYLTNSMLPQTPKHLIRSIDPTSPPPIKRTKRKERLPITDTFVL